MEALLRKLLPGIDFTEHLENDTDIEPLRPHPVEALPRNDADSIAQTLSKLQLDPEKNRFFGKSSGIQLVQVALNFQSNLTGIAPEITRRLQKRTEFWQPAFWIYPPLGDDSPKYEFPEPALMTSLIDLYFERIHPYYPLLHQPTFRTQVADELHLRDHRFAATLLMVCALGARHSEDPNVLLDNSFLRHTAGWKWHNQVRVLPKNLIYKPDLYELQTIALSSIYLQGLSSTAIGWNQIGFGLRRAQDVGAHRRRKDALSNSADNERWKRVFWVLLCQEWDTGTTTGRPIAMHEQDFDQVYPIECDDEFWDTNFEQPSNKPSQLTYFIYLIKLLEIQAAVTSNIYITRKPRDFSGQVSSPSDAQSIMAFDSSLNSWLSQVPDHLKWDPERQDKIHFHQSALLHTRFFYVQILLHRPFIPAPLELTKAGALPSLAICTSAARSVVGIFEALLKRNEHLESFFLTMAFTAGIVLLLNAWSGKRSGFAYNPVKELEQVEMCLKLLRSGEEQHRVAGRYSDILTRLMDAGARDTLEVLLDMKPPALTVVPPSPQPGYEAYSAQDWSYSNFPNLDNLLNTDSPFVFPDGDFPRSRQSQ
ncbi:hypothetical protein MIND_00055900 [Mycena indigotica]|uniref:Xylanolytic transcriptional activator regulatory domain-containing protein n=1 Tax=Mycena indigotica TaxID=2126181 RepID=A0A8H6TEQ7_9AGAR|nr:uncharacterized protein MIND_00055900 [Mycena indigotica]KAF7315412.1 hypothetical protein MIND_00055900 [Mycena indigotica]